MSADIRKPNRISPFSRRAAILSTLGCGVLGWACITVIQKRPFLPVLMGGQSIAIQILVGLLYGAVIGLAAWLLISRAFMAGITARYVAMTEAVRGFPAIVAVSLGAGVGEEILFRGALQYWLGVPLTTFIFVAVHGYLTSTDWRLTLYGLFLFLVMLPVGWGAFHWGVMGPIVAHAMIDIILLSVFAAMQRKNADSVPATG